MTSKLPTLAGYLLVGLIILWLMARDLRGERPRSVFVPGVAAGCALLTAVFFAFFSEPPLGPAAIFCAALTALLGSMRKEGMRWGVDWRSASVLLMVFCLASTLAWWRRLGDSVDIGWRELLVLQFVLVAGTWGFAKGTDNAGPATRIWWIACTAYLVAGFVVVFSTAFYGQPAMLWLSWHHWGAYVGPAQLLLSGVKLLHEVPAQYGFGPTVLLASTCGGNCWLAMYFLTGVTSLLYGALVMFVTARLCGSKQTPLQVVLIVLVVFMSVYVWTAYPPSLGTPSLTPSVSGMRFLPLVLLLAGLVRGQHGDDEEKPSEAVHLLWLIAIFWSPESAFQVSAVWMPYYVWASCRAKRSHDHLARVFFRALARLLTWLLIGCVAFLAVYRLVFGVFPTVHAYLAYMMYPPGPLPIATFGSIWFFGVIVLLGLVAIYGQLHGPGKARPAHNAVLMLLAAYAAICYFLGRSHDNNLLNISVFFVLLLLALRGLRTSLLFRRAVCGLLAALLAYPALSGWGTWSSLAKSGEFAQFHPRSLVAGFSYAHPDGINANRSSGGEGAPTQPALDAARAVRTISEQFNEPVTVLDPALSLEGSAAGRPWSAFHGPENYAFLPLPLRREFLAATAKRLNATGWLLIRKDYEATLWLADYDAIYSRDRTIDFGTYYAIRYVPRVADDTVLR